MPHEQYNLPPIISFKQPDGTKHVFIRNEEIGHGSFSNVYRVIHQNTNKIYAMKVISKKRYSKSKTALEALRNEIEIQKLVKHPNIISLDYSFSDELYQYFILEYCPGPNIREYLYKCENYRIKESEIRKILKDAIQGLVYLHDQGITHYDIKLENFVIGMDGNVKIGDFTLSTFQEGEKGKKFSIFGTFNYLSPEMIAKEERDETSKVDIWAIGVSTFYMLTGKPPFKGTSKEITSENILKGEIQFPLNFSISKEIKDFIFNIFQRDPHKRPSAKELLNHPFLTKNDIENVCLFKSSSLPPLNLVRYKQNEIIKQTWCQQLNDNKKNLPKHQNDNLKQPLCHQLESNKLNLCAPLNDSKQVSAKQQTTNAKENLCTPLNNDSKQVSAKQQTTNAKENLCTPLNNDSKQVSAKQQTTNAKENLCTPLNDSKQNYQQTTKEKPLLCPSNNENKQNFFVPPPNNIKPLLCPPINNNKQNLVRPPTTNVKPSPLCPPLNDNKHNLRRPPTSKQKPPLCPPLNDNKHNLRRPPTARFKSPLYPPHHNNKQISPRRPAVKRTLHSPRNQIKPLISKQHNSNPKQPQNLPHTETRPISPRMCILGDNGTISICADIKQTTSKSFIIPKYFVSRYFFVNDDFNYLLIDGTVGICFKDKSRIVMDPFEKFVQFYNNQTTESPEIIYLTNSNENEEPEFISLVKKASKHFKKIRFSYNLPRFNYDPKVYLHNITSFIKNEDSILFQLDDMNFQINFDDNVKMIILWNDKKLCFFRSFKEKCTLLDWNNVASMNSNSDELKKFKLAKVLLSNLSLTMC